MRPRILLLIPTTSYRADAFVEAAGRLDAELTVACERPNTLGGLNPTGLLTLDFCRLDAAVHEVQAFHRVHPIAAVVPVDDATTLVAAAIAGALGLPHNSTASIEASRDKRKMRERLRSAGVRVPAGAFFPFAAGPEEPARRATYPCVLKPTDLSGSQGVIRADNPSQFVRAWERIRAIVSKAGGSQEGMIVEEYVAGDEVAVEGLLSRGRLEILAIFDKPDPLVGPFFEETIYVTPAALSGSHRAAVADATAQAAAALGLREGPVHAELRINSDGVWIIEVAARSIGGHCSRALRFSLQDGSSVMTLEDVILARALGTLSVTPEREEAAAGVMMIPTPQAGKLLAVEGLEAARHVAGITAVEIVARSGDTLVPLPEGSRYFGFLFSRAKTAPEATEALRQAHAFLRVRVEDSDAISSPARACA